MNSKTVIVNVTGHKIGTENTPDQDPGPVCSRPSKSIGDVVFGIRKRLGLSQEQFAGIVGCGQGAISNIEADVFLPSTKHLLAIAEHSTDEERLALLCASKPDDSATRISTGNAHRRKRPDRKPVAEAMSAMRLRLHMTQADLAIRLNCDVQFVGFVERDRRSLPDLEFLALWDLCNEDEQMGIVSEFFDRLQRVRSQLSAFSPHVTKAALLQAVQESHTKELDEDN